MTYWTQTQIKDQYGFAAECTPMDELRTVTPIRLVGATFSGQSGLTPTTGTTNTDPNFWTGTNLNSATIAQANNQITLSSGTNSAGSAILQSVRVARYIGGSSNRFRAIIQLGDIGVSNNTRKWGIFNSTDGAYFQLAGTTLAAVVVKTGSPTSVATLSAPTTNATSYEIYITNSKVYFIIAGSLVATHNATTATWSDTMHLPVRIENVNSGSTTNSTISVRVATIYRLGEIITETIYKYITGAVTAQVCKYGPGTLHTIIADAGTSAATITIYDAVSAANTVMFFNAGANSSPFTIDANLVFHTGLTITTTGANTNITIVYE